MATSDLTDSLRELQRRRRLILRRLLPENELAIGSVSVVRRKCGNPRCHCAVGEGHLQTLFLFKTDDGQRRCKLIRRADEERLQRAGEAYRQFRDGLKQLRAIDREEKQILMATFTEEDVIGGAFVSDRARSRVLVNQATGSAPKD